MVNLLRIPSWCCLHRINVFQNQIDCKAGTMAEGQNLLANISTSRASLLQGQYNVKITAHIVLLLEN